MDLSVDPDDQAFAHWQHLLGGGGNKIVKKSLFSKLFFDSQKNCLQNKVLLHSAGPTFWLRTWSTSWSLRKPSRPLTSWMWMEMGRSPSTTSGTQWSPSTRSERENKLTLHKYESSVSDGTPWSPPTRSGCNKNLKLYKYENSVSDSCLVQVLGKQITAVSLKTTL